MGVGEYSEGLVAVWVKAEDVFQQGGAVAFAHKFRSHKAMLYFIASVQLHNNGIARYGFTCHNLPNGMFMDHMWRNPEVFFP